MKKHSEKSRPQRRTWSFALDPYLAEGTWTREELLRVREELAHRQAA